MRATQAVPPLANEPNGRMADASDLLSPGLGQAMVTFAALSQQGYRILRDGQASERSKEAWVSAKEAGSNVELTPLTRAAHASGIFER